MAWTAPRDWVVGEIVTAAVMNAFVRDNQLFLYKRPIWIASRPPDYDDGAIWFNWPAVELMAAVNTFAYHSWYCDNGPVTFAATYWLWGTNVAALDDIRMEGQSTYAAEGEAYNTHGSNWAANTITSEGATIVQRENMGLVPTPAFMSTGDYYGLHVERDGPHVADDLAGSIYSLGVLLVPA